MLGSISRFSLAVVAAGYLLAQPPRYTISDLGPLNSASSNYRATEVSGINIRGQVIGYQTRADGHIRAFRTAPNSAINWNTDDLGTLGGTITKAYGINASGQVVGESTLPSGETRGFRTAPNAPIRPATDNLGTLGGNESRALAINDSGQVTGGSERPFLTAANKAIDPATDLVDATQGIYHTDGEGRYINRYGHVLGEVWAGAPFYPGAFLDLDRTGPTTLQNVIRYIWEDFAGITDQDQIVFGDYKNLMLWQNGKTMKLADCEIPCVPRSVNNSLRIVGANLKYPFLYTGGVIYDLNLLIPERSGWTLSASGSGPSFWSINDLDQIAGIGLLNGEPHAFRMDPVPSAANAIQQALNMVQSLHLNLGRKSTVPAMLKLSLASKLKAAMESSARSSPAATRGLLNEFENIVRAHDGATLTHDQAKRLIEMAEAAIAMT